MSCNIEPLLTDLENTTAETIAAPDSAMLSLIERRGELIAELTAALPGAGPLTYEVWNRLVVVHRQGCWIEENLQSFRTRLAAEVGGNARGLAFLERVGDLLSTD